MVGKLMSRTPYISKSKFLHGLQCPKLLWCDYNAKHLFPEVDDALQAVFDQGHEVGSLAKKMFPDGIEIDTDPTDFEGAIELTKKYLPSRRPLFEATVSAKGGFARADILNPVGNDEWDIIEVKSTTSLKDVHIPDLAFQVWVFSEARLKIRRCFLCHINNQFVRHGASFEKTRLKECAELLPEYESWVKAMNGRVVDLLNPFRSFNFYHPSQCGSASMKSVLPVLTGKDYEHLEIQEGNEASREFVRVTFDDVSESERKRVRLALETYCGQDTEGMVWMVVSKSLERIADHATNIAEDVVYLCEGQDIRHTDAKNVPLTNS
jgi:hypothetical protein